MYFSFIDSYNILTVTLQNITPNIKTFFVAISGHDFVFLAHSAVH